MTKDEAQERVAVSSTRLLGVHDRQKVIESLFDELTNNSFAAGCEERIARGLEARTDGQLLELAKKKMTWTPNNNELPNEYGTY
jgi:hypothetical protein